MDRQAIESRGIRVGAEADDGISAQAAGAAMSEIADFRRVVSRQCSEGSTVHAPTYAEFHHQDREGDAQEDDYRPQAKTQGPAACGPLLADGAGSARSSASSGTHEGNKEGVFSIDRPLFAPQLAIDRVGCRSELLPGRKALFLGEFLVFRDYNIL